MSKYDVVYLEYQLYIKKFIKSAIINIHLHEITKWDLTAIQKLAIVKIAYKKLDRKIA